MRSPVRLPFMLITMMRQLHPAAKALLCQLYYLGAAFIASVAIFFVVAVFALIVNDSRLSAPPLEVFLVPISALTLALWIGINLAKINQRYRFFDLSSLAMGGLPDVGDKNVEHVILLMRRRAVRLRVASNIVLAFILITIAFGSYLFARSGRIAYEDYFGATVFEYGGLNSIHHNAIDSMLNAKVSIDEIVRYDSLFSTVIERDIKRIKSEHQNDYEGENSLEIMVASLGTRIGVLLLLVFLVQILVSLFRYNTRLASFISSRADALQLKGGASDLKLAELTEVFSSDFIDYGRLPATPYQQALQSLKDIVSSAAERRKE